MSTRPTMFKSSPWLKWTLLLPLWILSFTILIIFSINNELNTLYYEAQNCVPEFRLPKNQTGALSYTRWDPKESYRPIYSVCCKNLRAENNKLGIFKTALHKVVKISALELKFYQYASPKTTVTTTVDIPSVPEDITADARALIKNIIRKLITPADGWRVNIDLGNVSEVRINNFDYKAFYDGDLLFAVQSKRVLASWKRPDVILRGRVIITAADGSRLNCNYAKWNIKKEHFTIDGVYVLNRGGVWTTGKDICVDAQLNPVGMQQAKSKQKEKKECFAKL